MDTTVTTSVPIAPLPATRDDGMTRPSGAPLTSTCRTQSILARLLRGHYRYPLISAAAVRAMRASEAPSVDDAPASRFVVARPDQRPAPFVSDPAP